MEKGIENLKFLLMVLVTVVNSIKKGFGFDTIKEASKALKVNFKIVGLEIKDLQPIEIQELILYLIEIGVAEKTAQKALDYLTNGKANTGFGLLRVLNK